MRKARFFRGLVPGRSLLDVASATEIDPGALSRFERGERKIGYGLLKKLADYYGVTIDELLEETADTVGVA